jgi:hypothetical protein
VGSSRCRSRPTACRVPTYSASEGFRRAYGFRATLVESSSYNPAYQRRHACPNRPNRLLSAGGSYSTALRRVANGHASSSMPSTRQKIGVPVEDDGSFPIDATFAASRADHDRSGGHKARRTSQVSRSPAPTSGRSSRTIWIWRSPAGSGSRGSSFGAVSAAMSDAAFHSCT